MNVDGWMRAFVVGFCLFALEVVESGEDLSLVELVADAGAFQHIQSVLFVWFIGNHLKNHTVDAIGDSGFLVGSN